MMRRTLRQIIREESTGVKEINNVEFEILENRGECSLAENSVYRVLMI